MCKTEIEFVNIVFPVETRVKKYVLKYFPDLVITRDNLIGRELYYLLKFPKSSRMGGVPPRTNDTITFKASLRTIEFFKDLQPTERTVRAFHYAIDLMLHKDFIFYMEANEGREKQSKLINDFMSFYDFTEDDLTFESLKKYYMRHRPSLENKAA